MGLLSRAFRIAAERAEHRSLIEADPHRQAAFYKVADAVAAAAGIELRKAADTVADTVAADQLDMLLSVDGCAVLCCDALEALQQQRSVSVRQG
jgi:hypothetical protein